jgi:hypothetical protein
MKALERLKPPIILRRPAVVSIKAESDFVQGTLNRVVARKDSVALDVVPGSEFIR